MVPGACPQSMDASTRSLSQNRNARRFSSTVGVPTGVAIGADCGIGVSITIGSGVGVAAADCVGSVIGVGDVVGVGTGGSVGCGSGVAVGAGIDSRTSPESSESPVNTPISATRPTRHTIPIQPIFSRRFIGALLQNQKRLFAKRCQPRYMGCKRAQVPFLRGTHTPGFIRSRLQRLGSSISWQGKGILKRFPRTRGDRPPLGLYAIPAVRVPPYARG